MAAWKSQTWLGTGISAEMVCAWRVASLGGLWSSVGHSLSPWNDPSNKHKAPFALSPLSVAHLPPHAHSYPQSWSPGFPLTWQAFSCLRAFIHSFLCLECSPLKQSHVSLCRVVEPAQLSPRLLLKFQDFCERAINLQLNKWNTI